MELVVEPDIYKPNIDINGNYVDKVPSFHIIKKGIVCPCGSRKDKVYESHSVFSSHIKTKCHQKWLSVLNLNKVNYYVENEEFKQTIQNQKLIIAKMEKDINTKIMTIDLLTQDLNITRQKLNNTNCNTVNNLLEFD